MTVKFKPDHYNTVTPYLSVKDADAFMNFTQKVFGAENIEMMKTEDGKVQHGEARIDDSVIMFSEAGSDNPASTVCLYLYTKDVDVTFKDAIANGATVTMEPKDQFYGDRSGGFKDPCGVQWWVATHVEDVPKDELARRAAAQGN